FRLRHLNEARIGAPQNDAARIDVAPAHALLKPVAFHLCPGRIHRPASYRSPGVTPKPVLHIAALVRAEPPPPQRLAGRGGGALMPLSALRSGKTNDRSARLRPSLCIRRSASNGARTFTSLSK